MARRPSKAAAKARRSTFATSVAAVLDAVEAKGRARRVPGRKLAVVPLADLRRLRELEREAEDREDRAAVDASDANPGPLVDLDVVKARLGL